jgi:hypothetical protein
MGSTGKYGREDLKNIEQGTSPPDRTGREYRMLNEINFIIHHSFFLVLCPSCQAGIFAYSILIF